MAKRNTGLSASAIRSKKAALEARTYTVRLLSGREQGVPVGLKRASWEVQKQVLEAVESNASVSARLFGDVLPKNVQSLGTTPAPNYLIATLEDELRWMLAVLRFHRDFVNTFLRDKGEFERGFLAGDYKKAADVLARHRTNVGISLWYFDAYLQLTEQTRGSNANRDEARSIISQTGSGSVQVITALLSLRSERQTTLNFVEAELRRIVDWEHLSRDAPGTAFHIQFHVNRSGLSAYPDELLAASLAMDHEYALADRFQAFVKIIQVLISREQARPEWLGEVVTRAAVMFPDERLSSSALIVRGTADPDHQVLPLLADSLEAYTNGNYERALDSARSGILQHPDCFEFYEIYCASFPRLSRELDLPPHPRSMCAELLRVDRRDAGARKAIVSLAKTALELEATRFGARLEGWVSSRVPAAIGLNAARWEAVNSTVVTPRSTLILNSESALQLLGVLASRGLPTTSELFRRALLGIREMPPGTPVARALKYSGLAAERKSDFRAAADDYREILSTAAASSPDAGFAREALYRCLLRIGDHGESLDLAVGAILEGETIYFPTQVFALTELLEKNLDAQIFVRPAWPILAYLHMRQSSVGRDSHYVFAALDRFLAGHSVNRPSELRQLADEFPRQQLVYLLRNVCIPDILDWSLVFSSPEDLDHERIAILDWLEELDPDRTVAYEEERTQVTRRIVVQKGLGELNRGKINVDTAGVRQELGAAFIERVERYMDIRAHGGALTDLLPTFRLEKKRVVVLSLTRDGRVVADDEAQIFRYLHREVRDLFLWSDHYGLDSSLSVEIRHGNVAGQLRPPFERANLITQRDATEGRYSPNEYWLEIASNAEDYVRGQLDWIFATFSYHIDDTIERVKDRWIRIRSKENPEGLFDFEYTHGDLEEAKNRADAASDPETFAASLFDDLWQRTRRNLEEVRRAIRTDLAQDLNTLLSTLESDVSSIHSPLEREIRRQVAYCRSELEVELTVLERWFAVDEVGALSDYELPVLLETALERTRRLLGAQDFVPDTRLSGTVTLQGRTFRALYNILYIVIGNVITHARDERNSTIISLSAQDGSLRIHVSNDIGETQKVEELRRMASDLQARVQGQGGMSPVRQEGKSGYYKLGKLLRSDLKREDFSVQVAVTEQRRFEVEVTLSLSELVA